MSRALIQLIAVCVNLIRNIINFGSFVFRRILKTFEAPAVNGFLVKPNNKQLQFTCTVSKMVTFRIIIILYEQSY